MKLQFSITKRGIVILPEGTLSILVLSLTHNTESPLNALMVRVCIKLLYQLIIWTSTSTPWVYCKKYQICLARNQKVSLIALFFENLASYQELLKSQYLHTITFQYPYLYPSLVYIWKFHCIYNRCHA